MCGGRAPHLWFLGGDLGRGGRGPRPGRQVLVGAGRGQRLLPGRGFDLHGGDGRLALGGRLSLLLLLLHHGQFGAGLEGRRPLLGRRADDVLRPALRRAAQRGGAALLGESGRLLI